MATKLMSSHPNSGIALTPLQGGRSTKCRHLAFLHLAAGPRWLKSRKVIRYNGYAASVERTLFAPPPTPADEFGREQHGDVTPQTWPRRSASIAGTLWPNPRVGT
jgi:hypothetical protein